MRSVARCFRCPQERRGEQAGWHFFNVPGRSRLRVQMRIYVCPLHYAQFAGGERVRWAPLTTPALSSQDLRPPSGPAARAKDAPPAVTAT
ncbi:MAG: hypothetical protein ACYDAB_16075 [bacterium]